MECDCEYCIGRMRLVPFELVKGLLAEARHDRVTIKPDDLTFVIDRVRAVACVRMIGCKLARLCGCWVGPEFRHQGIGRELVTSRIGFIEHHTSARAIDTYAFNGSLFERMGFVPRQSYKIGTTLMRRMIER